MATRSTRIGVRSAPVYQNMKEYYWGGEHDVRETNRLYERVNYYHKPQANLNWHWTLNDKMRLSNVLYASTGRYGSSFITYGASDPSAGLINFDATIERNLETANDDSAFALML